MSADSEKPPDPPKNEKAGLGTGDLGKAIGFTGGYPTIPGLVVKHLDRLRLNFWKGCVGVTAKITAILEKHKNGLN